jgi:hypothetical protein
MKSMNAFFVCAAVFAFAASAQAADVYRCDGMHGGNDASGSKVTLTIVSAKVVKVDEDRADLDEKYNPRLNKGFKRFEYESSDEGVSEVLVQEKLLSGAATGMIKLQNRGEGWATSNYFCHR